MAWVREVLVSRGASWHLQRGRRKNRLKIVSFSIFWNNDKKHRFLTALYLSGFTGTTCNYNNIIRKNNSMVPLVHQDFVRLIQDDPEVLLKVKPAYDIILRNSEKLNIGENPAFERFCITKFRHCLDISMDVYKHLPKSCGETEGLRMHHKILTKCLPFPEISIFQSVGSLSPRLQLHSMRDEIDNIRSEFQDDEDFEINISATDQKRLDFYKEYLVKLLWREFFKCSSTRPITRYVFQTLRCRVA